MRRAVRAQVLDALVRLRGTHTTTIRTTRHFVVRSVPEGIQHCANSQNSFGSSELAKSETNLEVEFAIDGLVLVVDEFEGVAAVAVHVPEAVRSAAVAEQERHLQPEIRVLLRTFRLRTHMTPTSGQRSNSIVLDDSRGG